MGEIAVNSRVVARFKFSRFDKFEARNRPHLHILIRYLQAKKTTSKYEPKFEKQN